VFELKPGVVLSDNAMTVLEKRYLRKDASGRPRETPAQMFRRVADNIANAERKYGATEDDVRSLADAFLEAMISLEFIPNSPTLMNAGRELQQLSACFVLPVEDSIESIFDAIKNTALIHKSGGGTGFSFSRLRPRDDIVRSTHGVSSGPISFMGVFNAATEAIKQGGTRRGANMAILRVDHPDILEFIDCKRDGGAMANFNISVGLTGAFMEAVRSGGTYRTVNPRNREVVGELDAREVFDRFVEGAWRNGEPGIVFLDRINEHNPTPQVGDIEATNPCGEQPLLPYESCNLGSVNLVRMLRSDGETAELDYAKLASTVELAVRFLDDVIDVNRFPLPEIAERTRANRKIGLGVMGWADVLFELGIPYDSGEAVALGARIMDRIRNAALQASMALAAERGAFPNYPGSRSAHRGQPPLRNSTLTTIAPTGTISMIAGVSSGIEPLFAIVFRRHVLDGEPLLEAHPAFARIAEERGFASQELIAQIAETGTLHGIEGVPDDIRRVFVCAHDIEPVWHVRMQAAFQQSTDNAVSKTVNFPNSATREDVREVFVRAYESGCKGVTVYRDGSRSAQVLSTGSSKSEGASSEESAQEPVHDLMQQIAATGAFASGSPVVAPPFDEGPAVVLAEVDLGPQCPDCGGDLAHESGCAICRACGYSECL
jgi:ribonucleoside-diphosphate reductase alpha chain